MAHIRILGIDTLHATCDCCGKTRLKRTVVVGCGRKRSYLGTVCASRIFGKTITGNRYNAVARLAKAVNEMQLTVDDYEEMLAECKTSDD
jgi:hypothetical protein